MNFFITQIFQDSARVFQNFFDNSPLLSIAGHGHTFPLEIFVWSFLFIIVFIQIQNSRINNSSTILVYASARAWLSWSSCSYCRSNSSLRRNWRRYSVVSYQPRGSRSLENKTKYVLSLGNRRFLQTNRKWDRKDWAKCWEACLYSPLFHSSAKSTAADFWSNTSKQAKRSYQ